MKFRNDGTPTNLYLVRKWRGKSGDSAPRLRGKLMHIVSGATFYFVWIAGPAGSIRKANGARGRFRWPWRGY